MDVAAYLVMVFLSASFAGVFSDEARASWQSVALASWQHVVPLLIMAFCMPWCANTPTWHYLTLTTE